MTTINELIKIEEKLLKLESKHKYEYTLNELIKSKKYLKEIGEITDLYFSVQYEYSQTINPLDEELNDKLIKYQSFLSSGTIDVDISKYTEFINQLENKNTATS
jgi:hypothetical protein